KVILVGNLGKDPVVRSMGSGDRVATFSLATSESWRDKNSGERKEKTEWHNIAIFNDNIVKVVENYLKKGSKVYIEGQLSSRKYTDKDGVEKYMTEVVVNRFKGELTMLDGRGEGGGASDFGGESGGGYGRSGGGGGFNSGPANRGGGGPRESFPADLDDEIPF
ncbi:MAG: single-stranded DNA-binding protein, partial [Proteobacteria bacterium]|nr:single-stranded DNA-binding protein [Pseudomonadota bacterium]